MNREKILEIAEFRGIKELICKRCGTVSDVGDAVITEQFAKNNKLMIRADCPECSTFIQFLPSRAVWEIFMNQKYGLVEIEKINTSWLEWALKNRKDVKGDLRTAVEQLLERRTTDPASFIAPPPDIDSKKEIELMDLERYLVGQIADKHAENKDLINDMDPNSDFHGAQKVLRRIEANNRAINNIEIQLRKCRKDLRALA